ncbi:MAG: leucine--tRNA ligase [Spirochaetales bacterium]|nr:leucine--tRNA ligase [Spirochaetales bacterium]
MAKYPFTDIEKKWQARWDADRAWRVTEDPAYPKDKRAYVLDMFPYPSGAGLHAGHVENYTITDMYCRYLRMNGYNVLHPMGFDAFGLPAENYAIKTGTHPAVTTKVNVDHFREQIKSMGFLYDWDREFSTTDDEYYAWTQWIFLQLYKRGLAYESDMPINWCPSCKTGLANEEVVNGECDRCHTPVTRKRIRQWVLRITAYADRLLSDLDKVNWPEPVKAMQRNWIGRSEGAQVVFAVDGMSERLEVFTTRPDTLFGATYMVLAPEHALVSRLATPAQKAAVDQYVAAAAMKSDLERTELSKDKTGVFTGSYAVNPVNGRKIPIWISDYVLASYGTGAIMAVPAHDERDWAFAKKFGLPIVRVVAPSGADADSLRGEPVECHSEEGVAVNSGDWDGMPTAEFKKAITAWLEGKGLGKLAVNYKLRDWLFSRQRYWGEPMPLVHCERCGVVPLPESELPLRLPEVDSYEPSGTGESPLATIESWVNTTCPVCGGPARRETNTMPQWAGSCWYYLRFLDPRNKTAFAGKAAVDYWMPVDLYVGGVEHAVLHLLYARFWHKVLFDLGLVNTDEPFLRLVNQGQILGTDGQRMSKSRGNTVNPDDYVAEVGADALRVFIMFMGPIEAEKPWSTAGLTGVSRFLERCWALGDKPVTDAAPDQGLLRLCHKTVRKVSEDTGSMNYNTAISQMMVYSAELAKLDALPRELYDPLVLMLAPYAPHLAEELWEKLGHADSIVEAAWPRWDPALCEDDELTVVVQVNGKLRGDFKAGKDAGKDELERLARAVPKVAEHLAGKDVAKVIVVPGKLVNFVVKG